MLTIRLSRIGKKNKPMYRLIISEKAKDPLGRALEIFGSYNPYSKELSVKEDRIKYWLSQGAGMSATVNNLLIDKAVIQGKKVKASKAGKPKKAAETGAKEGPVKTGDQTAAGPGATSGQDEHKAEISQNQPTAAAVKPVNQVKAADEADKTDQPEISSDKNS